jgi:hypothetical protein
MAFLGEVSAFPAETPDLDSQLPAQSTGFKYILVGDRALIKGIKMTKPQIRILPHSKEEFPSLDMLTSWMLTALKARGGRYLIRSASSIAELPLGSIVLFRYGHVIVGEAVVSQYVKDAKKNRTLLGQETQYEAYVELSPSSIRVFVPPLPIEEVQTLIGESINVTASAQPYYKFEDWDLYPKLLAAHVGKSGSYL